MLACNTSGSYDVGLAPKFGLVSFDWENEELAWLAVANATGKADCKERMVAHCHTVKAASPTTKCLIYRNTELALEWLGSQRAVMDERHAGWFLRFQGDAANSSAAKCAAARPCT